MNEAKCASSTQIDAGGTKNYMILYVDHLIPFHKDKIPSFHMLHNLAFLA